MAYDPKDVKIFMLTGWGRAAAIHPQSLEKDKEYFLQRRGKRWGISVEDDGYALLFQRADFRLRRIAYAFGKSPLLGHASWTGRGFHRDTPDEIAAKNRESIAMDRARAYRCTHSAEVQAVLKREAEEEAEQFERDRWADVYGRT